MRGLTMTPRTPFIWEGSAAAGSWYCREPYTPTGRSDVLAIVREANGSFRAYATPGDLEHYTTHATLDEAKSEAVTALERHFGIEREDTTP
jgi:hypothetical protein